MFNSTLHKHLQSIRCSARFALVRKCLALTSFSGYGGIPTRQNATPFIGQLNLFCRGIRGVAIKITVKEVCYELFFLNRGVHLSSFLPSARLFPVVCPQCPPFSLARCKSVQFFNRPVPLQHKAPDESACWAETSSAELPLAPARGHYKTRRFAFAFGNYDVAGRVTGARARCVQGHENKALFVPR